MAVWDLNSNLDVFGMQTFLRGLIYCEVSDTGSSEPLVVACTSMNRIGGVMVYGKLWVQAPIGSNQRL